MGKPQNTTILRVFPRRTNATPTDRMVRVGYPPPPACRIDADEVHISVTFTWDKPLAEDMHESWKRQGYAVTALGGPAFGSAAGDFAPGMYVREGMTFTSRGCPMCCEFCLVPRREGSLRLLEIKPGWDILDNNLLACPRVHVEAVLDMLAGEPKPARFTGGVQASRVRPWFAKGVAKLRLDVLYLAYDRPQQRAAVERAAKMLLDAGGWAPGTARRKIGCYVLAGYDGDTDKGAIGRFEFIKALGITPFPMFFRPPAMEKSPETESMKRRLRKWMRPWSIFAAEPDDG
jgi:hypothetical protein